MMQMQRGDVKETLANVDALQEAVGFRPTTTIETGLRKFVDWYQWYYSDSSADNQILEPSAPG